MPSIQLPLAQTFNITNVSFGVFTLTNRSLGSDITTLTTKMIGYAVGPGGSPPGTKFVITYVASPGVINVKLDPWDNTSIEGIEYNFDSYNGGLAYFEPQLASW
jgi:hypothetical protein